MFGFKTSEYSFQHWTEKGRKMIKVTPNYSNSYTHCTTQNSPSFKSNPSDPFYQPEFAAFLRSLRTSGEVDPNDDMFRGLELNPHEELERNCKEMGLRFYDDIFESSAVQCSHYLNKMVLPAVKDSKPQSLCDLGCGNGAVTRLIAAALDIPSVVGVENGENCGFHGGEYVERDAIAYLRSTDKKFDMISVCMPESLRLEDSHFNINPRDLFKIAPKRLNDGGHLFIYAEKKYKMDRLVGKLKKNNIKFEKCEYDSTQLPRGYYNQSPNLAILVKKEELEKLYSNPSAAKVRPAKKETKKPEFNTMDDVYDAIRTQPTLVQRMEKALASEEAKEVSFKEVKFSTFHQLDDGFYYGSTLNWRPTRMDYMVGAYRPVAREQFDNEREHMLVIAYKRLELLAEKGIRTIINFDAKNEVELAAQKIFNAKPENENRKIAMMHLDVKLVNPTGPLPTKEKVEQFLSAALNPAERPVYACCGSCDMKTPHMVEIYEAALARQGLG